MPALTCVICREVRPIIVASATGERAYCSVRFHGWRPENPGYVYSNTAMCSLGTSRQRLETQIGFFAPFTPARGPDALGRPPRTVLINGIDFADDIADDIGRLYPGVPHILVRIGDLL